jgi:hypothetical protein
MKNISLGEVERFALLAGAAVKNVGATIINGDVGLIPGGDINGFPPGQLIGTLRINDDVAKKAKVDLIIAYNEIANRNTEDIISISGNIGGLTLTPGLYKTPTSLEISSGDLTFDAQGNDNAVFIVQISSTFHVGSGRKIILRGNASAANIFWQVSSTASFGTTAVIKGNIMALDSIKFEPGATLDGRALSRNGEISLVENTIFKH